jgi:molybdopterin molybdotransferase
VSDLHTVEEARAAVLAAIPPRTVTEHRAVVDALGLVLAEPIVSLTGLPPWDNSAMDGYAIRAADVRGATEDEPAALTVIGEIRAGVAPSTAVERGTAIRIATGAPVPPGADAVVQVELTTPTDAEGTPTGPRGRDATGAPPARVLVHEAVHAGAAIRRRGSDLTEGTTILTPGGHKTTGSYSRHNFTYTVPAQEPDSGQPVSMQLVNEHTIRATTGQSPTAIIWKRCEQVS